MRNAGKMALVTRCSYEMLFGVLWTFLLPFIILNIAWKLTLISESIKKKRKNGSKKNYKLDQEITRSAKGKVTSYINHKIHFRARYL